MNVKFEASLLPVRIQRRRRLRGRKSYIMRMNGGARTSEEKGTAALVAKRTQRNSRTCRETAISTGYFQLDVVTVEACS